jgi:hypothetical protein
VLVYSDTGSCQWLVAGRDFHSEHALDVTHVDMNICPTIMIPAFDNDVIGHYEVGAGC